MPKILWQELGNLTISWQVAKNLQNTKSILNVAYSIVVAFLLFYYLPIF